MARRVTLASLLDPVTLAHRLKAAVPGVVDQHTPAGVMGRGTEAEMTLWYYRPNFQNSFQTMLNATIDAAGDGSRIEGRIGAPRGSTLFFFVWIGFVGLFLVIGLVLFALPVPWQVAAGFVGIPLFMLAIGALIAWLGLRNGPADEAAILDFLSRTADAKLI